VIVWEVNTSRIVWRKQYSGICYNVQFQPVNGLLVVACEESIHIFNIRKILNSVAFKLNEETIEEAQKNHSVEYNAQVKWVFAEADSAEYKEGLRVSMKLSHDVK
jgi:hypothetical protein